MSFWLWQHWFGPWLLDHWGAKPLDPNQAVLEQRLQRLAQGMRLPAPKLLWINDFSPNAAFLLPCKKYQYFVVTEGLLQALSAEELDAVFCHGLVQSRSWRFRRAAWLGLVFHPLAWLFGFFPKSFSVLLSFFPQMLQRTLLYPRGFAVADREVASFQGDPYTIAAALQKSAALARKIPLRCRLWPWNSVFWISPVEHEFPVVVRTHPPLESRLAGLLNSTPSS